jgi:histidinol phosphatase-like PHP family hydrolase
MKILNPGNEDYHIHTFNFSDGWNTVDEIVQFAGKIGLTKIALCDHSSALLKNIGYVRKTTRDPVTRYQNVYNDVQVIFGVESDLMNDSGNICIDIDGIDGAFILLSYHKEVFKGSSKQIAQGFVKAIQRHCDKINCIGHVCNGLTEADAKTVILAANEFHIPVELNAKYFLKNPPVWNVVLENAENVYVNSDAHILADLRDLRPAAFKLLKEMGDKG